VREGFSHLLLIVVLTFNLVALAWFGLTLILHPAPVARRVSLRAMARDSLLHNRPRTRWRRIAWDLYDEHRFAATLVGFVLVGAGVGIPWLFGGFDAVPDGVLSSEKDSEDFLQTMWQVVAGSLGLSVAMIAFAFEAFFSTAQRQVGGSLREFAAETRLLWVVRLGVLALLVDGMVLLHVGYEAPGGWAAAWAILLSSLTLIGVLWVLGNIVRALDLDELLRMRRNRLRATVAEAMWQQLVGQMADTVLEHSPEMGVNRAVFGSKRELMVRPKEEGTLRDVHLGSLARLAFLRRRDGLDASVDLLVGLGSRVSPQRDLIAMAPGTNPRVQRLALRALRIERAGTASAGERLGDQLGRLHSEATVILRDGRVEAWRPIGDLYKLVLDELMRTAREYGVPFAGAIASPGLFGFGPMQRIGGYIEKELEEAVRSESAEGADAVSYLPGMIARTDIEEGDLAITREMLRLYPRMYMIARHYRDGQNRAAELLLDRSTRYLTDYEHKVEEPFRAESSTALDRTRALDLGRALFAEIGAIMKLALDDSDSDTFEDLGRRWDEMFEDDFGYIYSPDRVDETKPVNLISYRLVLELGLAMWAVHTYARREPASNPDEDTRVRAIRQLSARYHDAEALFDVYEEASAREVDEEGVPWTFWFAREAGEGRMHPIPTESELLFTTFLILVGRTEIDLDEPELRSRKWHDHSDEQVEGALARVRGEAERWAPVFGLQAEPTEDEPDRWTERVDRLSELLADARRAAAERRMAEIRAAELDPAKVAEFRRTLLTAVSDGRLIHDLFQTLGGVHRVANGGPGERIVTPYYLPKQLLIAETNMIGVERTARDLGRATRMRESDELQRALAKIEMVGFEGDLASRLREEIAARREAGRPPTTLLIPTSWRLREALGLSPLGGRQPFDSDLVPPMRSTEFAGLFEEVPVLDLPRLDEDRLWLIDLPAAATYVEWPSEENTGIELELREFDPVSGAEWLDLHPEFRDEGQTIEEALLELQTRVLCRQFYCWRIEPGNSEAGIALIVPAELRR